MKLLFTVLTLLATSQKSLAGPIPDSGTETIRQNWNLTDISAYRELSAFFHGANALIVPKSDSHNAEGPEFRPTIFVYKIKIDPKLRLSNKQEWNALLSRQLHVAKGVTLSDDPSIAGRYLTESMSSLEDSPTDLHSLYLALRNKDQVILFVYDGLGASLKTNLALVRTLYSEINMPILLKMYVDGANRQKE